MAYSLEQKKTSKLLVERATLAQNKLAESLGVSETQIILLKKGEAGLKPQHLDILRKHYAPVIKALFLDENGGFNHKAL